MLRCLIFICITRWTWCSAAWSWLRDLRLHFYMSWILRCLIFSCISIWTWCSPACSNLMLRCLLRCFTLTCSSTWWTWCSAPWSSFAFLHELDAPLLDLHLLFYMNLMLRCLILTCISTWTWISAAWSCLHFYMNLMLRCLIFICISTWTWCTAAWSSLAVPHELDAPLLDLLLHFYMNLMLRCLIFTCIVYMKLMLRYLLDLHLHVYMNLMPRCLIFTCMSRTSLRSVRVHVRASDRHRQCGAVGQSPLDIH